MPPDLSYSTISLTQERAIYGYVYKIWNTVSGKVYIGQTAQSVDERWYFHKYDAHRGKRKMLVHRAIHKYGSESFQIATLHVAFSKEELDFLEESEIRSHNSCDRAFGYNLAKGGSSGMAGYKHSAETRAKNSAALKLYYSNNPSANIGRRPSVEQRAKKSVAMSGANNPMFGIHLTASAETRAKIGAWGKDRKKTAEHRARIGKSNRGQRRTPEQCANNSAAHTGKKASTETCAKITKALTGRACSPTTRTKMSESRKLCYADPCARAKMSESLKLYYANPEQRARMSEIKKRWWVEKKSAANHAIAL